SSTTRRVVICVDGSHHAQNAARWAVANIIRPAVDDVLLVNVRKRPNVPTIGVFADLSGEVGEEERAFREASHNTLRHIFDKFFKGATKEPFRSVRGISLEGDPRKAIEELCDDLGSEKVTPAPLVVVVGSRGEGAVNRALMGSVSDNLMRHLKGATIIITRDQDDDQGHPEGWHGETVGAVTDDEAVVEERVLKLGGAPPVVGINPVPIHHM
ncbi:hypothetical protein HK101_006279, partial [Irineochytrium annulatum]